MEFTSLHKVALHPLFENLKEKICKTTFSTLFSQKNVNLEKKFREIERTCLRRTWSISVKCG